MVNLLYCCMFLAPMATHRPSRASLLAAGIIGSAALLSGTAGAAMGAAAVAGTTLYATLPSHLGHPSTLSPAVLPFLEGDDSSLPSPESRQWYTPLTVRPADFLLEGVTADELFSEAELMWGHAEALRQQCSSLSLDAETRLSEGEVREDAPLFFATLEEMLGPAAMPPVVVYPEDGFFTLEMSDFGIGGLYFGDTVFVFNSAGTVLPHEMAHVWTPEESWTEMLAKIAAFEVADGYWEQYLAGGDAESGRRACVYDIALWRSLAHKWNAAGLYLERLSGEADHDISENLMVYDIVPALALRRAFAGDGTLEYDQTPFVRFLSAMDPLLGWTPGWCTFRGREQTLDFSALAGAYGEVLAEATAAEYDNPHPLKPSIQEEYPKEGVKDIIEEYLKKIDCLRKADDMAPAPEK